MGSQSDRDRRAGLAVSGCNAAGQFLPGDLDRTDHIGRELGDRATRGNHLVVDFGKVRHLRVLDTNRLDRVLKRPYVSPDQYAPATRFRP